MTLNSPRPISCEGENEQAIRELFSSDRLAYLKRRTGWSIEGKGSWLVVYRASKRPKPEELFGFLRETSEIYQLFAR